MWFHKRLAENKMTQNKNEKKNGTSAMSRNINIGQNLKHGNITQDKDEHLYS